MRITAADYGAISQVSAPDISPDGSRLAYLSKRPVGDKTSESTVFVVSTAGESPRRFTARGNVDSEPRFSPSGDRIAFTSTRGEDDRTQLWVLPTDGGEARQVTTVSGGVKTIAWAPDGTRIAFVGATTADERATGTDCDATGYERETPDPRVVDRLVYREAAQYLDGTRAHVYVATLDDTEGDSGGEAAAAADSDDEVDEGNSADTVVRLTDGEVDHASPSWLDDETLVYAAIRREDGGDADDALDFEVVAHDLDSAATQHVIWSEAWGPTLAASTDGRVVYPRTPTDEGPPVHADLEVVDVGTGETTVLTHSLDRTVAFDRGLAWGPEDEHVYAVTPDEGDFALRRFAADGSDIEPVVEDGDVSGFAVGPDVVAVTKSDDTHPDDVFVVADGEERRLTEANADFLAEHDVGVPEEVWFDSGGHRIQGWLLHPPEFDPDEQYPLVTEVHGGPHAMWTTAGTVWHEFQTLAARGYVVFWSNPRGSTGYGRDFATAIQRDWGAVTAQDVLAGVDHVCERDYVDDSHLFLTGGSFGGFMTAWLVGHTDRFRAAVAQRGVYDLSSFYGSTDAFNLVEWDFETTPWESPAFLWEQSPVATAHEVTTPTLLVHADDDFRVPVNNAELLYLVLKKNGVDTRLVRYPREGHELSRSGEPGHVVDRLERIGRWFDGYSDYCDVPRALDRGVDGLSGGLDASDDERTEE